ncbi:hypothetical protein BCR37DRAFT_391289 [Protomyces lactucae-debilis]|uniref:Uncharacterized protein n=1 Tax=Protomyces lactucae-debilis TaxID=2754530 RepID=A0A1Y2FQB2_PROLT|nr:uncharacterized protein BCR37DRAFT_391289 [Protomyces lactucae-debilis]ORY85514.1 hypothetical protein BCR37DRAFT_391289 [Protomyces lactucae-debilis]
MAGEMDEDGYVEPDQAQLAALASFMPDFEVVEHATGDSASSVASADAASVAEDVEPEFKAEEGEEFTYRLFSNVSTTKLNTAQEEQRDDVDEHGDIRYIHVEQKRSFDYYYQPSRLEALQSCTTVIDGDTVLKLSQQPWPGCAATDRVMHIKLDLSDKGKKRWRPSKARRDRFKLIKEQEAQKERQRAASRAGQRGRGGRGGGMSRTRGRGRGS